MSYPQYNIGDLCEIIAGATPKSGVEEFWDGDVLWATPKDLSDLDEQFISDTPRKITSEGLSNCSAKVLPANSVLFSSRAPIGLVAINTKPMATNQGFKSFVPNPEKLNSTFLYWWLLANRKQLQAKGRGATFKEVSKAIVEKIQIPLPPLDEQKRIAGILDTADALRARRRESLAKLDDLLQSTFLDMFGDPVTNPKGWEVRNFGSLGNCRLGKMLDKAKQTGDCQYPYLANTNVKWGRFEMSELRQMDFNEADREEFKLEEGDLLICEGGEVGRCAIWREDKKDVFFQKALHRMRLDRSICISEYSYFFMYFMAMNGGFRDLTTSATIPHLTGVKLKKLPVPIPPLDLQQRFAEIVSSVEEQKAKMRKHLEQLDDLFASLQQRAFRGDL